MNMKLQVQDINECTQICEVRRLYKASLDNGDILHFYIMFLLSKLKYRKFYVFLHDYDVVGFICLKESKDIHIISYGIKDEYKNRGYQKFMLSIIKHMYEKKSQSSD